MALAEVILRRYPIWAYFKMSSKGQSEFQVKKPGLFEVRSSEEAAGDVRVAVGSQKIISMGEMPKDGFLDQANFTENFFRHGDETMGIV